ncbi:hypothetical protein AB3S75_014657 [Citrus x aurantiifolia]
MPLTVMAVLASSTSVPVPVAVSFTPSAKFQIKKLSAHLRRQILSKCSITAQSGEPNKAKLELGTVKKRLWDAVPKPVKQFQWKKAENTLFERLLLLGKKALKWSLVTFFIFSSLSDVVFSISTNQELMIPFGLLVGCLLSDFSRETLNQLLPVTEGQGQDQERQLLSISCFFVLVKFVSACFAVKQRVFLLHVGNGGLLQALWPVMQVIENDKSSEENSNSTSNQNAT